MKINLKGNRTFEGSGLVYLNGKLLSEKKSLKVINHSPTGFMWGYGGSGPAQLALAILLELTDKETAIKNYQDFKEEVISKLATPKFDEVDLDISKWIK